MKLKILAAVLALISWFWVTSFASKDYALELKQEQKKLIKLTSEIAVEKKKLKKLAKEYESADKAMRRRLFKDKSSISKKEFIRESKMEQEKLRSDYYKNKTPLKKEYNRLNKENTVCKRAIKRLTRKIDRIANDPDNEVHTAEIKELKSRINERKKKHNKAIAKVRENADNEIAAITDMRKKSAIKKQILSKAKGEESGLRKKYAADKAVIAAEIVTAKTKYKNNLKLWRMKKSAEKKEEQLKKIAAEQKKIGAQPVSTEEDYEKKVNSNFSSAN